MRNSSKNKFYLNVAMFACITSALLCIATLIINLIMGTNSLTANSIFTGCWNAIFYLIVGNYYYRSRDYKGRAFQATLILAICTFIIPSIVNLVFGLIYGGISGLLSTLYILAISLCAGIVYSIALILFSRRQSRGRYIFLFITGIILFVTYILSFGNDLYVYIKLLIDIFQNISSYTELDVAVVILQLLNSVVSIAFGFVYFYTPIYLKRN